MFASMPSLTPLARSLAAALAIAAVAGCSTGATQTGASGNATHDDSAYGGSAQSTAAGTAGAGTGTGSQYGSGTGAVGQQADARIPEVRTIYFDFDRDTIKDEYESVVMAHARYLRANDDTRIILKGHTDERGTREYNLALGERRANAVKRFLRVQGVSGSQVNVVSYGEERPAARGQGEAAYTKNRRVEFTY
ncbi:peptidoglycan-associated lipoprotein Pal [Halomonas cibimaris]|uniref:Peptidoglycan-associated protein n=1 Tax=Halomonas cibimaris TaxID=657012 RepID=A0ABP7LU99_9GAMM